MSDTPTAAFTPNPWTVEYINDWPFGVAVKGLDGSFVLEQAGVCCSTTQKTRADYENGVGFKYVHATPEFCREYAVNAVARQDSNARLIAAAPDLLDALMLARKTLLVACGADAPYIRTALKPIDAAIAKATGVQPLNNGDAK